MSHTSEQVTYKIFILNTRESINIFVTTPVSQQVFHEHFVRNTVIKISAPAFSMEYFSHI